jgi:hypothetical protein
MIKLSFVNLDVYMLFKKNLIPSELIVSNVKYPKKQNLKYIQHN